MSNADVLGDLGQGANILLKTGDVAIDKARDQYDKASDQASKLWGGPFKEDFKKNDHDLGAYLGANVPWGLGPLFDPIGRWPRRLYYILFWFGVAYFFAVYIIGPAFLSMINKEVSTTVRTVQYLDGVPFPTITVCPKGSGMRCDCMMWKQLACTYLSDRDPKQSDYFASLICSRPDRAELEDKCRVNWANLDWANDSCQGEIDSEELFNMVNNRYSDGFPYLTSEEMMIYSGVKFDENITEVSINNGEFGTPNIKVNSSWVNYNFLSLEQKRVCMQVRVPADERGLEYSRQTRPGTQYGMQIIVNNTFERELSSAKQAGVDLYFDFNDDPNIEVSLTTKTPVTVGQPSSIGFEMEGVQLLNGYGNEVEKNCVPSGELRTLCIEKVRLLATLNSCNRCSPVNYTHIFGMNTTEYQTLGCDFRCLTEEDEKQQVSFEECPQRCNTKRGIYTTYTSSLSKFGREQYQNKWKNAETILEVNIGANSLSERSYESGVATEWPSFVGFMGGNLNLFFGPDMMTTIGYVETVVIGVLLSFRRVPGE